MLRLNCAKSWVLHKWEIDSFDLGWDLAEALVMPFAQERSLVGLSAKTRMKVSLLLRVHDTARTSSKASEQPPNQAVGNSGMLALKS